MVLIFLWEPSFDLKNICTIEAPVWVNLLMLSLMFEDFALEFLGQAGKVVYIAPKYARSKFSNVLGFVKVDLTEPSEDFVVADIEGIGHFKMNVAYSTLSHACFYCH